MDDTEVMSCLEGLTFDDWSAYHSDSEVRNIAKAALELLKEQEHKDKMFHALEEDWKRLKAMLKEQQERIETLESLRRIEQEGR